MPDLVFQRRKFPHLTDEEFRFMVQQEEGRERLRDKLPTLVEQTDWWFPPRLACEQCSSERTATYKAELIRPLCCPTANADRPLTLSDRCVVRPLSTLNSPLSTLNSPLSTFIDLTGGYGIDSFYLSAFAEEAHYVEQDPELCRIAAHNFARTRPHMQVHNTTAEEFLCTLPDANNESNVLIYLDPARRDTHGGKVFRIEDCTPNIIDLLPLLQQKSTVLMIKLSPMLDITAALRSLGEGWQVHVVAVRNEVKELLFVKSTTQQHDPLQLPLQRGRVDKLHSTINTNLLSPSLCREGRGGSYTAANYIHDHWQTLTFTLRQEQEAQVSYWNPQDTPRYLYEPNAAILKAAAFRFVSEHFRLAKLAPNTHLYAADHLLPDFPGRVWEVISPLTSSMLKHLPEDLREQGASILTRNYPLSADQLRKKLKLKDSATRTIIAARAADKPMLFLATKP
ncbi:MAG: hypothetical protein ACI3Z8_02290 [Paludibacteraceae bacterium]